MNLEVLILSIYLGFCTVCCIYKSILESVQVSWSTKQRTEHRAEYERQKRERLARMEQERLDKERQLREQEEQEIRRLRASTVQKASRIRHYKPISVLHSDKPATVPKSPTFSHK